MSVVSKIKKDLKAVSLKKKAESSRRFFKTGKGEYGEGDVFIGVIVPEQRKIAKKYFQESTLFDIETLLKSKIHEHRFTALEMLVFIYKQVNSQKEKEKIVSFYLKNTKYINNWDLVDTSAPYILGDFLIKNDRAVLYKLAQKKSLWDRRIAIVSTWMLIRSGVYKPTLDISEFFLQDDHDLIQKSVGWMLREVGKKDMETLEEFLKKHHMHMPRTMLRYAIEKFPEEKRQQYLKGSL